MKVMDEKVMFRMPGDELTAFKQSIRKDGLTISVFLRMSIKNYLLNSNRRHERLSNPVEKSGMSIPFWGCLRNEQGNYRDRAAEYVLGRR